MRLADFSYDLPPSLIAQKPASPRDTSRFLVLVKKTGQLAHRRFYDLPSFLKKGDVLVFNDTAVFKARLWGKKETGGKVEVLLLSRKNDDTYECLTKPGLKKGQKVFFTKNFFAEIIKISNNGKTRFLKFIRSDAPRRRVTTQMLEKFGQTPTPPYIQPNKANQKYYQTVYADLTKKQSVAAPTAGFHFTNRLLKKLRAMEVETHFVTLHVGLGTFAPVKTEEITKHKMHEEEYFIEPRTLEAIIKAKNEDRRVIAVGTTSARVLETVFRDSTRTRRRGASVHGRTGIFIYPPHQFRAVDGLITNFHLPKSTLLMLVAAFTGLPKIKKAYAEAIKRNYRFYSFGDAMLII